MSRIQARELAFKLIFAVQFNNEDDAKDSNINFVRENESIKINENSIEDFFVENELNEIEEKDFCLSIVNSFLENKAKIEDIINRNIVGYKVSRVYKCDLAILKMALAEMLAFQYDYKIVIDASIEIAKKYSEEKSYKFIHSVLGKIIKEIYNE
ncbi:MAG: transcription antitermination factor NusB [Christensenellales bacterium]